MRRQLSLTICLLLVAAGAAFAGVATAGASTSAKPVAKASIKIVSGSLCKPAAEFCFKPSLKSVAPGTKVTWVNKTLTVHTVTRCSTAPCGGVSGGTGKDTGFGSTGTIAQRQVQLRVPRQGDLHLLLPDPRLRAHARHHHRDLRSSGGGASAASTARRSSAERCHSTAATFSRTCSGRVAPEITEHTTAL